MCVLCVCHVMCMPRLCHVYSMRIRFVCHVYSMCVPYVVHLLPLCMTCVCHVDHMCTPCVCHLHAVCMPCVCHVYAMCYMCLSGLCPQPLYLNPVGHVAVSMYVCGIAAQGRARCPYTFHLVSHERLVHRLVAQISYFPPLPLVPHRLARGLHDEHLEGHRPIPKDRSYMQFSWVCLMGVGASC